MCDICDGYTHEEVLRATELHIIGHGWALQGVEPDPDRDGGGWTYTVGLIESFAHPELVITDTDYQTAGEMLNALGEGVRAGDDIRRMEPFGFTFRDVHPAHFENDLLNTWFNVYGRMPEPGMVWQVVLPDHCYCDHHRHRRTDLSDRDQFPSGIELNRNQRRARQRRGHTR